MPNYKLTLGSTELVNDQAIDLTCVRPENNVSSLIFHINDYKSKSYVDLVDVHTEVKLEIAYRSSSYTTVFNGLVHKLKPVMEAKGEILEVQCWGWGIALAKTTCDTSYGTESANPNTDTPEEILDQLIPNHVVKRWAGTNTEWSMDTTDIDAPHADFSVTNLTSQYLDNFTIIQRLCDLINAHAVTDSDISVHWIVDTDKHFRMKEIDQDSGDSLWTRYYGGTSATATLYEGRHFTSRGFVKHVEDYANSIVLASAFRKPAQDIWCEDNGPAWGNFQSTESYSNTQFIVGSHSLRVDPTVSNDPAVVFYPSTHDAGWDLTYIGSPQTIPTINFYMYAEDVDAFSVGTGIVLGKDWTGVVDASGNDDKFSIDFSQFISAPAADTWFHVKVPIGPYAEVANNGAHWIKTGTPTWDDIDFVALGFAGVAVPVVNYTYFDDVHFSGKIVRHVYDTSEITATKKERQLLIRLDTALDDSLVITDHTGTASLLATAELYKRTSVPTVGTLEMDCREDMLPGQTLQIYAGLKQDGTYRWSNQPMRVKELTHTIFLGGYKTRVEVTSDVTNSNVAGVPNAWGLLMDYAGALGHGEAKDLKASGVDNLIKRLGWDPT